MSDIEFTAQSSKTMPVYLLAGQSNMEGNVDPELFNGLLKKIQAGKNKKNRLEKELNAWYEDFAGGYARYAYDPLVCAHEAQLLLNLKRDRLINAVFPRPDKKNTAYCTNSSDAARPLSANCGNPFGPELMFSKKLAKQINKPFTIVKVARGGTSLAVDWISPSASNNNPGPMYKELAARIASLQNDPKSIHAKCAKTTGACKFDALIWFQGENDCFDKEYAENYRENLAAFVNDVRALMNDPNFPVVIVQVGFWASTLEYGATVLKAQADFVADTPNTALVTTDDLSKFYHLDPAAQMIIGERAAVALNKIKP